MLSTTRDGDSLDGSNDTYIIDSDGMVIERVAEGYYIAISSGLWTISARSSI